MVNQNRYDPMKTFIVKKMADKRGVSQSLIRKVINGDRINEELFSEYIELYQEATNLVENKLLKAVNELVPFN